jgi:hypothetical protein
MSAEFSSSTAKRWRQLWPQSTVAAHSLRTFVETPGIAAGRKPSL